MAINLFDFGVVFVRFGTGVVVGTLLGLLTITFVALT